MFLHVILKQKSNKIYSIILQDLLWVKQGSTNPWPCSWWPTRSSQWLCFLSVPSPPMGLWMLEAPIVSFTDTSLVALIIWLWAQKFLNLDHQTWSAEPWVQSLGAASGSCFSLQMCAAVLSTFWVWSKLSRLPSAFQKVRSFSDSQAKSMSYLVVHNTAV